MRLIRIVVSFFCFVQVFTRSGSAHLEIYAATLTPWTDVRRYDKWCAKDFNQAHSNTFIASCFSELDRIGISSRYSQSSRWIARILPLSAWADAIERERESRSTIASFLFRQIYSVYQKGEKMKAPSTSQVIVFEWSSWVCLCMKMATQFHLFIHVSRYLIKLSDYISHSMKLLACFPRLKISFENNRARDSVACITLIVWSSKNDERPPVSLNYLLENKRCHRRWNQGEQLSVSPQAVGCRPDKCLPWRQSSMKHQHLTQSEHIHLVWTSSNRSILWVAFFSSDCAVYFIRLESKDSEEYITLLFDVILRWLIISFKRICSHLLGWLEKKPWAERRQRLTNYSFLFWTVIMILLVISLLDCNEHKEKKFITQDDCLFSEDLPTWIGSAINKKQDRVEHYRFAMHLDCSLMKFASR